MKLISAARLGFLAHKENDVDTFYDLFDRSWVTIKWTGAVLALLLGIMVLDAVIYHYTGFSFLGELLARGRLMSRRG